MPHARRLLCSTLSLALVTACNPPAPAATEGPVGPGGTPVAPADPKGEAVAELTNFSGPVGARTEDLPEGTFLGPGAKLRAGQTLLVPRGTIVEIRLSGGTVLRINEDTRLTLPDAPDARALDLDRGELVAIVAAGQPPLALRAGADTFDVSTGEARVLARGDRRSYDVVYGSARLRTAGQDVPLGPGAHVDTPLAPQQPAQPEVSLRPLEDTAWSRAFEVAARMADAVPAGVGSLTARRAGSQTELYKLALVDQKVHVAISGRIARTEIEQTFYNEAAEVLEGTYRFPLPADASISGLQLLVGNTWMNAEMLEKQRARAIFKQIVDATIPRDPALLEWERGNIFKLKIFPIPGRGERKIRLSYTQVLPVVGDDLRYRYPMTGASSGASGTEIENFEFAIEVDKSELPATGELVTPMAALQRRDLGDRVELATKSQRFRPVHDLGVDIPLPEGERRVHTETHLDRDGQAYFMLAFKPDLKLAASDRPRHFAFVLDRSHSTTPDLWTVARSLVQSTAATLRDGDRITVLACDAACDVAPGGLGPASGAHLAEVERFLDGQLLAGASDIGGMMRAAAAALGTDAADPKASQAERVIVYLGDGSPSAGALAPDELLRDVERPLAGTRVQAVALGARSDLTVLSALARKTGGDLLRADAKDDLRGLARELGLRAALPVARNVDISLPHGMVYTHPEQIAGVRPGETITLVGKLSQPVHGPLTIQATGPDGQVVSDRIQVDLEAAPGPDASRRAHLPRTWAREEIEALTAGRGHAARAEIIDLSRQYTVLSRYTALLVLENDAMYREFNVVRQSGRTTGWTGKLEPDKADAKGTVAPTGGVPVATAPAPAQPVPKDMEAARPEPRPAESPAFDPAPPPAPMADAASSTRENRGKNAEEELYDSLAGAQERDDDRRARGAEQAPAAEPEAPIDLDDAPADEKVASRPAPTSTPAPAPAKKEAAKSKMDIAESWDGDAIASGGGVGRGYGPRPYRPKPVWKVSPATAPTAATTAKIDALRRAVDIDPTSRSAHRKLVQAAIRAGATDAFTYARAWAEADPDHAPALMAVADLLAARSDPATARAYASAAEVKPFDKALHQQLAQGFASKGDLARSCAHRRALVSIDPARAGFRVDLARCLSGQGRTDMARETLAAAPARTAEITRALRDLDLGTLRPQLPDLPGGADLRASLVFTGVGDVDIAVVDPSGRRLSALRPDDVLVAETANAEELIYRSVRKTLAIEVSRLSGQGAVTGQLTLRTPTVTRTYPFTLDQGSLRLATVGYSLNYGRVYYDE
ncbi:FecR family protein [Nannocystis exedens]|uniref:FecR family protein n=1 Tax=Nannocystis exedens TaxID=54 RepID=A0A1I1VAD0_9BACT|nr:VIT domain-containing protein [Nannocystis exedens]PCC72480.1 inter-alpha-trypsin inhibitor family heavy chain-related protein [Nannocystis exedens]SFD79874.1 FecR family protein [Nannocystis exedens]